MLWLLAARGLLDGLVFLLANWPALASARRHRAQRRRAAAAARGVANSSGGGLGSLAAGRASLTRQATYGTARIGLHTAFTKELVDRNGGGKPPLWMSFISSFSVLSFYRLMPRSRAARASLGV